MSLLKFAIGWPLTAVALFFVGKIILSNAKTVSININELNFLLLFSGIFCYFLFYFIRTYVWKTILKEQGYDIPQRKASFLWEISELKRFVPGNIWSFLSRGTLFSSVNVPAKVIAKALLIEIESFLLGCLIISSFVFFIYPKFLPLNIPNIFLVFLTIILLFSIVIFINHSWLTKYIKGGFLAKINVLFPNFSSKTNAYILLVSLLYLFLFGIGTYLTITSLTIISPALFFELSMFCVVALLIGYLSFLTPMGLGVRESAMIVGLSQFMTIGIAGFSAIFARVVLILSELSFLLFTYFWQKAKNKYVSRLENFVSSHKLDVIMIVLTIIYIVYFTVTTFLRYDNFYTGRFDLGNMDQTVWNTIHGRIFELTDPNGTKIVSRLAFHADFILILLAPLYLLWEDPRMLLLIQTIVLAFGAIFVYKIAKEIIKNNNIALAFGISFLLNPAVQYTNLYDFHPVTLATNFLLGAFYFLLKKRYYLFLLFAILAALTKEQIWVIIAIFGIYILLFHKDKEIRSRALYPSSDQAKPESREANNETMKQFSNESSSRQARTIINSVSPKILGLGTLIISVIVFYLLIWHAIPNAKGSQHFAISYYSDFGNSPTNIIKNVFASPHKLISIFTQKDQLNYLSQLFLPLGFLSFLFPLTLIFALPDLFINLLSSKPQLHQIYYQYSATITPFIFIAAIYGVSNLIKWFPKIPITTYAYCLLLTTLYSAFTFGPMPFSKTPNIDMFTKPQKNKIEIQNFITKIPTKYSVSATNSIGSHLAHRQKLYNIPLGINTADYIVFLLDGHFAQPSLSEQEKMVEKVESDKNYSEVLRIDNFIVFKKHYLVN